LLDYLTQCKSPFLVILK